MEDRKALAWYTFGLVMLALALLAVLGAIMLATGTRWPEVLSGSLASKLTADYGAESAQSGLSLAPVNPNLLLDLLIEEGLIQEGGRLMVPDGPLATAIAPFVSAPAATPTLQSAGKPTATPSPKPGDVTPTADGLPTQPAGSGATGTPRVGTPTPTMGTPTPTPTRTPTLRPTNAPDPTRRATVAPATEPPTAVTVDPPPPPPTPGESILATPPAPTR